MEFWEIINHVTGDMFQKYTERRKKTAWVLKGEK
jgi:hypothetical protein